MNNNTVPAEELVRQKVFADKLSAVLEERFGHKPVFFVHTYGCQQNVSDSERIKGILCACGFSETDDINAADLVLYNTCAVRAHAEDRVYGNLGALKINKRRNPNMLIAVCGCMIQQKTVSERIRKSYPYVDLVFGTHSSYKLPEMIYRRVNGSGRVFELEENDNDIAEGTPVKRDGTLKGWIPVMYGCDNFCTYCIVPYVRGRERSRSPEEIIKEAKELVDAGYKEITLLGQNVNSYGKNPDYGLDFGELLRRVNAIDGDFRIRFMTSHPKDCTDSLLSAMHDCEKVCRHLHLPFQSGSDEVLKKMNRGYTAGEYIKLTEKAKELMPDICLTSDIIVGFPSETYEDFLGTVDLVKKVRFSSLFTFIYSPREGTFAATMPDPVTREEKGRWFSELLSVQDKIAKENAESYIGRTFRVICDDTGKEEGFMSGHTEGNAEVEFKASADTYGKFVNVCVTEYSGGLKGIIK